MGERRPVHDQDPPRALRCLLLGRGTLALALLEGLLQTGASSGGCQVAGVLPWPEPAGRADPGDAVFRHLVRRRRLRGLRLASANDPAFPRLLARLEVGVVLVASWGERLACRVLGAEGVRFVNCHPSLLPAHRGANPYASVIRAGERETGVTFHLMTDQIDAGPVLLQARVPVHDTDTGGSLRERCAACARSLVPALIEQLSAPDPLSAATPQCALGRASRFPGLRPVDAALDFRLDPGRLRDHVRAVQPWLSPYAVVRRPGPTLRLAVAAARPAAVAPAGAPHGAVLAVRGDTVLVGCAGGAVALEGVRLVLAGRQLPACLSRALCGLLLRPSMRLGEADDPDRR